MTTANDLTIKNNHLLELAMDYHNVVYVHIRGEKRISYFAIITLLSTVKYVLHFNIVYIALSLL